jgi:hypothetical protein
MRRGALLAVLVLASGCDQPPLKEVAAAERQIEAARQAGADRYTPDRLREAVAALEQARKQLEARDYRSALSSASDAAERARVAADGVKAARNAARMRVELGIVEALAALDAADAIRKQAVAAKIPEQAFAGPREKADGVRRGLRDVSLLLQKDEVLEAAERADAVKVEAAAMPETYRAARAQWEEDHPRGRPRARAPRRPRQ